MKPKIGEFYYHFKHKPEDIFDHAYVVTGFGYDGDADREVVLYKPLYAGSIMDNSEISIMVRSIENFTEMVTREGKTFERFMLITDENIISQLKEKIKELYLE